MGDPLSVATGIIALITLAVNLVAGAAGLIDKTVTAHREAANELQDLQQDLERLEAQIDEINGALQFLVANTKDRAFKNLLQEYVPFISPYFALTLTNTQQLWRNLSSEALQRSG
jgi:hypothetical protein